MQRNDHPSRPLTIVRSRVMGMCFGVREALRIAERTARPEDVTIHGELVHNDGVQAALARRGFRTTPESGERAVPATKQVLVTAHGISERERARLSRAGKELVDTTCPLVRVVHAAAQRFAAEGCFVVVIGKPGHVEVRGITEDLAEFAVVSTPAEVRRWDAAKIGIVCQSTARPSESARIAAEIRRLHPESDVRFADTICQPTRDRQAAIGELLERVEAVVVVGGRNSNNTRALAREAERRGRPALHVTGPDGVDADWLAPFTRVGLTAGTSTPDAVIDSVHARMRSLRPCEEPGLPASA